MPVGTCLNSLPATISIVDGPQRDAVLGIHRMVEGIQLMGDRVPDLHEVSAAPAN
ncbi:DUF6124 family protein [Pseudomonas orientalis]|uniref:DUF6124 family protein n=1 Tax=Pseudomonas orientalis TaxID=76758 RepID=UPI003D6D5D47